MTRMLLPARHSIDGAYLAGAVSGTMMTGTWQWMATYLVTDPRKNLWARAVSVSRWRHRTVTLPQHHTLLHCCHYAAPFRGAALISPLATCRVRRLMQPDACCTPFYSRRTPGCQGGASHEAQCMAWVTAALCVKPRLSLSQTVSHQTGAHGD